jgi:hypothetical protein
VFFGSHYSNYALLNLAQVGDEQLLETERGVHAASTSEMKAGRVISASGHGGR